MDRRRLHVFSHFIMKKYVTLDLICSIYFFCMDFHNADVNFFKTYLVAINKIMYVIRVVLLRGTVFS